MFPTKRCMFSGRKVGFRYVAATLVASATGGVSRYEPTTFMKVCCAIKSIPAMKPRTTCNFLRYASVSQEAYQAYMRIISPTNMNASAKSGQNNMFCAYDQKTGYRVVSIRRPSMGVKDPVAKSNIVAIAVPFANLSYLGCLVSTPTYSAVAPMKIRPTMAAAHKICDCQITAITTSLPIPGISMSPIGMVCSPPPHGDPPGKFKIRTIASNMLITTVNMTRNATTLMKGRFIVLCPGSLSSQGTAKKSTKTSVGIMIPPKGMNAQPGKNINI